MCHPCHPCMRTCVLCLELSVFFLVCPSFYFLSLFLFQLYLMSISAPDELSVPNPLCDSSLGSVVTSDYVTPLTFGGKGDKGGVGGFQKGTKGDKGGYQKGGKGGKGGKAGGNGGKGPAGGCFECGGPHYASECPHMSRQASAFSLSNWWPGGAEDRLQVAHLAFIMGREMRKGAGRDTKVVTGNKF